MNRSTRRLRIKGFLYLRWIKPSSACLFFLIASRNSDQFRSLYVPVPIDRELFTSLIQLIVRLQKDFGLKEIFDFLKKRKRLIAIVFKNIGETYQTYRGVKGSIKADFYLTFWDKGTSMVARSIWIEDLMNTFKITEKWSIILLIFYGIFVSTCIIAFPVKLHFWNILKVFMGYILFRSI